MKVRLIDLAVMLQAATRAAKAGEWHDADNTLHLLRKRLNHELLVSKTQVESLLSAVQDLNELKIQWHPDNLTAAQLIQRVTPHNMTYDADKRTFSFKDKKGMRSNVAK